MVIALLAVLTVMLAFCIYIVGLISAKFDRIAGYLSELRREREKGSLWEMMRYTGGENDDAEE